MFVMRNIRRFNVYKKVEVYMKDVVFVTGNPEKAMNFSKHMGINIAHEHAELDEIQTTDHIELVEHKAKQAYAQLKRSVIVEDVFFTYEAWGSLPGPFVKFFVTEKDGLERMCRMLDGFTNRRAIASCVIAYFDGNNIQTFAGRVDGSITDHPRGTGGYGYDRIFVPDGSDGKTAAELTEAEYDQYYTTIKPFQKVREFLQNELQ